MRNPRRYEARTAERIRDKVAASRRKGMWMGGVPPYGYRVENRKLVIDDESAAHVRWIFSRFTLLAPDIVDAILDGKQGPEATLAQVLEPFPGA